MARFCLLPAVLAFTSLAGCATQEQQNRWTFVCPNGFEFTAMYARDGESVEIIAGDDDFRLQRVRSASGARYSDGESELWSKGAIARLELLDDNLSPIIHDSCQGDNS